MVYLTGKTENNKYMTQTSTETPVMFGKDIKKVLVNAALNMTILEQELHLEKDNGYNCYVLFCFFFNFCVTAIFPRSNTIPTTILTIQITMLLMTEIGWWWLKKKPHDESAVLFSDRWLNYKAVGKRLCGTRFIAFKVPLKEVRLTPSSLF